ncbi:hypothetical protein FG386_000245 [Cryptosporidium ryanae]|uniref:uncharacterized protein n=1 Tax=Cryptosporidium ryanae TaxID=515981 RepID=UPI00351A353B|nr:hypothetical protein FG386_000245 [Cryptosporidium ryanae]
MKEEYDKLVEKTRKLIGEVRGREKEISQVIKDDRYSYDSELLGLLSELENAISIDSSTGNDIGEHLKLLLKRTALHSEVSDIVIKGFPELIFDIIAEASLTDKISTNNVGFNKIECNESRSICNCLFLIARLVELPYFYSYFATYWLEVKRRKELDILLESVLAFLENKGCGSREEVLHSSKCLMTTILLWERVSPIRNYLKNNELLFEIMERFMIGINRFESSTIKYLFVRLYSNLLELNENGKFVELKDDSNFNSLDIYLQYFIFRHPVIDSFELLLNKGLCWSNSMGENGLENNYSSGILKIYHEKVIDEITRTVMSSILTCSSLIFLENITNGLQVYHSVLQEIKRKYFDKYHDFNIIRLYLDNTIDSKSLLGNWVVGDKPGEFKWEHGVLSLCLIRGDWLLVENIQDAPKDVIVKLNEISEVINRDIFVSKNNFGLFSESIGDNYFEIIEINKRVKVHPNFRIFSSCITTKSNCCDGKEDELNKRMFFGVSSNDYISSDVTKLLNLNKWNYCIIPTPTIDELTKGLELYHSNLNVIKENLLGSFQRIINLISNSESYFGVNYNKYLNIRKPSCKDFFKGCTSISRVIFGNPDAFCDSNYQSNYLSERNRMKISFLFSSVLLDHIPLKSYKRRLQIEIFNCFGINSKESEHCIDNNKFSIHFSGNENISNMHNRI